MKFGPTYLGHFEGNILVRCPKCSSRSHLNKIVDDAGNRAGYRFICDVCIRSFEWSHVRDRGIPIPSMGPHLAGFGLDLWLQTPCCDEVLWAFNEPHIGFIERFISAALRERGKRDWGWSRNSALESRLPRWIQIAKNRPAVLKSLGYLREMLEEGRP